MSRLLRALVGSLLLIGGAARGELTSPDVYEARTYRVDTASESQSALTPVGVSSWDFGEAVPYSTRQPDLVLRSGDPLAVWLPTDGATSLDGTRTYFDRMPQVDLAAGTVTLDRYERLESQLSLPVLVGPSESSYWIGSLPEGDYEFILNDWRLPGIESDPLAGLLGPPELATPWTRDLPNAAFVESLSWRFSVIPEPAGALLALAGLSMLACRR